jgi:hypothetical protein
MIYILFLIQLSGTHFATHQIANFGTMDECFDAREVLVQEIGRPVVNYQAICVIKTQKTVDHSS